MDESHCVSDDRTRLIWTSPRLKRNNWTSFAICKLQYANRSQIFTFFRLRHYSKCRKRSRDYWAACAKRVKTKWLKCMFQLKIWAVRPLMSERQLYEMNGWLNSFLAWNIINYISHVEVLHNHAFFLIHRNTLVFQELFWPKLVWKKLHRKSIQYVTSVALFDWGFVMNHDLRDKSDATR